MSSHPVSIIEQNVFTSTISSPVIVSPTITVAPSSSTPSVSPNGETQPP